MNKTTISIILILILVGVVYLVFESRYNMWGVDSADMKKEMEEMEEQMMNNNSMMEDKERALTPRSSKSIFSIRNQPTGANAVLVDTIKVNSDSFVVVHENDNNSPGNVLGVSDLILSDDIQSLVIPINRDMKEGESVFVVVHKDDGDSEFSSSDPILLDFGNPLIRKVYVVSP